MVFPQIWYYTFFKKTNDDHLPKNSLKNDISGIIEKYYIHLRKYGISNDRIIKDDKKVYSVKYTYGDLVSLM